MSTDRAPMLRGTALAVLAALAFGASAPVVASAGRGVGPLATASTLYVGAALAAAALGVVSGRAGRPLLMRDAARLSAVAVLGACVAPSLLAWGLQRSGAAVGSLLLNFEAAFTALFAWALHREPLGRRALGALVLMTAAGAALARDGASAPLASSAGVIAVVGATAAWSLDNALSRGLADVDPLRVVAAKGSLGAALTASAAVALGERAPSSGPLLVLLACGATGYGLSLRLYLLAQREMGAARTASVFAVGPFVGAALAWGAGGAAPGPLVLLAAVALAVGVALHATEAHGHPHVHAPIEHDHPHEHGDLHHDHLHQPPFAGVHSHPHAHPLVEHDHPHAPDLHHEHRH